MSLNLPNDPAFVPLVRGLSTCLMRQLGVVAEDVDDTTLVIGEICGNVVRHARSQPESRYTVDVDYCADHVLVTVTDQGGGFDRSSVPPPEPERASGWGLWLIENLSERVEFRSVEGGTAVRARLKVRYLNPEAQERAGRLAGHDQETGPGITVRACGA